MQKEIVTSYVLRHCQESFLYFCNNLCMINIYAAACGGVFRSILMFVYPKAAPIRACFLFS